MPRQNEEKKLDRRKVGEEGGFVRRVEVIDSRAVSGWSEEMSERILEYSDLMNSFVRGGEEEEEEEGFGLGVGSGTGSGMRVGGGGSGWGSGSGSGAGSTTSIFNEPSLLYNAFEGFWFLSEPKRPSLK